MSIDAWLWLPLGFLSLHFASFIWKKARRGHGLYFSEWLMAAAAGYVGWNYSAELWASGRLAQATALAFWWCAASPVLATFWFAHDGAIRRGMGRMALAVLVGVVVAIAWGTFVDGSSAGWVGLGGVVLFLVRPELARRFRTWHRSWRRTREERRVQQAEERARQLDEEQLRQAQDRATHAEQRLRQSQVEVQRLRQQEAAESRRREQLRAETVQQLRQVRQWERQQMQGHGRGMVVHPSRLAFVLLEAARVLRAEVAAGERIPPLENDPFLLEVADRLLERDDFVERYLHRKGEKAVQAMNRYLQAEISFRDLQRRIGRLRFQMTELAPIPLPAAIMPSLLEAWLVPQRRFQEHQRQRFVAAQHPHQAVISEFLRPRCSGIPEAEVWKSSWDDSPAVFVHGRRPRPPRPRPSIPQLRQRLRTSAGHVRHWINAWRSARSSAATTSSSSTPEPATPTSTVPASPDPERPAGSNT